MAQHAATELCIPHVACSRGSDLGCNIFTQTGIATIEFVIKRAFKIITTNQEHRRFVQHICDRSDGVQVIYNSLPNHIRPIWRRRDSNRVRLVSAVGYSVKKGTAILLESVSHLIDEGLPVNLDVFGPTEPGCWGTLQQSYSARYGERMILQNMIDRKDIESLLVSKDIYCSASLSEGCSNATMLALGLGMPVVSTATGALVDLASGCQHVAITTVASVDEFTDALRRFARRTLEGTLCVNTTRLDTIVDRLSHKRERAEWLSVIGAAAGNMSCQAANKHWHCQCMTTVTNIMLRLAISRSVETPTTNSSNISRRRRATLFLRQWSQVCLPQWRSQAKVKAHRMLMP